MSLLERTLRWVVLAGTFLLPFIVFIIADNLFFPYITGKNFAFRIIVEVITGAWLALALANTHYQPRRTWLLAAFSIFVAIIAIADAQGAYPFKSFWSNYERMDGWVTLAHLFAYFVVASSVLNTERLWHALWKVSLGVSVAMGSYGLLQIAGITSLAAGFSSVSRIDATFGNPIYLAVFMLFHVFLGMLLLVREGKEKWTTWERIIIGGGTAAFVGWTFQYLDAAYKSSHLVPLLGIDMGIIAIIAGSVFFSRRYLYASIVALDVAVIFLTGTRGTILGFFGGTILAVLAYALSSRSSRAWKALGATVVGLAVFAGAIFVGKDTPIVHNIGFLNRLSTISLSDSTVDARFLNWGMALKGVEERPFLGWGQENYAVVFDKYYDPRMYAQEQWFDRVHNIIFDWLVAGGVIGLLSYLSLFAAALFAIWTISALSRADRSILTGLLAAYFFHDLFVFDNISSYLLFATVLAYVAWRAGESMSKPRLFSGSLVSRSALPIAAACAVLGIWGTVVYVNAGALDANQALLQALTPRKDNDLTKNLAYFKQSISYGSFGTQEAREQLIQGAARLSSATDVSNDVKTAYFTTAAQEMTLMHNASPLDARFPLFLGVLLEAYDKRADAAIALDTAHKLSPSKQTILFEVASNKIALNDGAGALATYKQAFELNQDDTEARVNYAALAIRLQQSALADQLLTPIVSSGEAADPRIIAAYVAVGDFVRAAAVQSAKVKTQPTDVQGYYTLAAIYYKAKDTARAVSALQAAKVIDPADAAQIDQYIAQVKSGTVNVQ